MTTQTSGSEYEQFVYEKFKRVFVDAEVRLNDKITGRISGLTREIDVSVRMTIDGVDLLYITQCKDWARKPADIRVLGEFASVMEDVGAAKGFVLCTAGFARTNHKYARAKGIELVTIEDVASDKWHVEVEIPLVLSIKDHTFFAEIGLTVNAELVERSKAGEITYSAAGGVLRVRRGDRRTIMSLSDCVKARVESSDPVIKLGVPVDLSEPGLEMEIADVWVPCDELICTMGVRKRSYLKYLKPDEYSQLTDHVRGTQLPLHIKVAEVPVQIDDSFIELDGEFQGAPGLWFYIEQWSQIEKASGLGPQE